MAAPPKIKRLSREDFKDAPPWIERLLQWLNLFIEYVSALTNKGITFDENIQAQIKSFEILAGAAAANNTVQFTTTLRVVPRGLVLMRCVQRAGNYVVIGAAVSVEWRYENGTVFITGVTGLTAGNIYDLTVLLL